ncbi:chain-length determining protein [Sphingomonas metalli]|uniref:Chain-length determining protein n=1 Tax=Sphingomonas metalli TaxID=1779358 RepID=A0A916SZ50_9SPHN|nr:Wzz/FepE/Etk N-terminal domain-containing protein [Sphingomonas metalli]GGB24206.1 chain-length determining protein [Sphingomonas metalli]
MSDGYGGELENEQGGGGGLIAYLPSIIWQRRWWIILPLIAGTAVGAAAAFLLPASYRSSALMLVESPQLSADLVGGDQGAQQGSPIDRRIAKIRQQILSRPDLIELIEGNNLYPDERQRQPLSAVLDKMRASTSIAPVSADIGGGGPGSNTIAFSLSFEYPEAQKAQLVAQDFVERLVKLDATQTAEQATGTVEFLEEQANNLTGQINAIERQIESIKLANGMTLSNSSGMLLMTGGGNYQAQIASLQRENSQLQQQLQLQATATDRDQGVIAAEAALASARAVYSDSHPDVLSAQKRLDLAKKFAQQNKTRFDTNPMIRSQIASNNAAIANLEAASNRETARASAVAAAQARGPAVQEQISQLEAKADGLRTNFQKIQSNLLAARGSARISEQQRGERLTVIDPPVAPDRPSSPNRPMLLASGIAGGGGFGVAMVLLLELIARPIRGVAPLQALTGEPPLVIVPKLSKTGKRASGGRGRLFGRKSSDEAIEEELDEPAERSPRRRRFRLPFGRRRDASAATLG